MMEEMKKNKKWLWLVIAIVAVLVVVGVVLGIVLSSPADAPKEVQQAAPKGGRADLYWNIDRSLYANATTGMSAREANADGSYDVTFAHDGEQVTYNIRDKRLVNYIDTADVMGLVFDDDGNVVDAVDVTTVATELAKNFYVVKVEGNVITLNGSLDLNGLTKQITCEELTKIYSLVGDREFRGEIISPEDIKPLDRLAVYGNDLEQPTHIGVMYTPAESAIYWRIGQFYNYAVDVRSTTRVPDENGVYSIEMFCNGEYITLKSKIKDVVSKIDSVTGDNGHFGLIFDEDGFVINTQDSQLGVRGRLACNKYDVTELVGRTFTATNLVGTGNDVGNTYTNTIPEGTPIYDLSSYYTRELGGKALDNVQLGDRIFVWEDTLGNIVEIFVYNRRLDLPVYYRTDTLVNRKPDADGWYVFEIFNGEKVTNYKTKNETLAMFVEQQRFLCMETKGDVITNAYVYSRAEAPAYTDYARYNYKVSGIAGMIITLTSSDGGTMLSKMLSTDCKVYNLSGIHQEVGAVTTLQNGDSGYYIFDATGQMTYAFITNRKVDAGIYYNLSRMYNTTEKCTARTPVDGWYVFQMAHEGKVVTIKTKSKAVASKIDQIGNSIVGLNPNKNGIVTDAYNGTSASGGQVQAGNDWTFECYTEDGKIQLYRPSAPEGKMYLVPADDMKTYNIGNVGFSKFRGEADKVEAGDRVMALTDANNKVAILYITGHTYKNTTQYCQHCKKKVEFTPWTGTNMSLVKGNIRHYYIPANVENAEFSILGDVEHEKGNQIVIDLNGKSLRFADNSRGFLVYSFVEMSIMDSKGSGKMISGGTNGNAGMFLLGVNGTINLYSGTLELPKDHASITAGGIVHISGANTALNLYGGKLVSKDSKLEVVYMDSGTINIQSGAQIAGAVVAKASAVINMSGKVTVDRLQLQRGILLDVTKLDKKSSVGIVARGVFTTELTDPNAFLPIFTCPVEGGEIVVEGNQLACYGAEPDYSGVYEAAKKMNFSNTEKLPTTCPYCDRNVVWQPLPEPDPESKWGNSVVLGGGLHYYLDKDRTIAGTYMLDGGDICLHLNGKTITSIGTEIFSIFAGKTLTVMGDGTVKGSGTASNNNIASVIANNGVLNLCGGTYQATADSSMPVIANRAVNSNEINIYDGTVQAAEIAFRVGGQRLTMVGGTVKGEITTGANAQIKISGGKLDVLDIAEGYLNVTGGNINKLTVPETLDGLQISGAPVIGKLDMTNAKIKAEIGQLTTGAKIAVDADGIFTADFADEAAAEAALAFFEITEEGATIWREGKALGVTPAPYDFQTVIDKTNAMTFTGNAAGDAGYCYHCDKEVTWMPLTTEGMKVVGHYYLANDVISSNANGTIFQNSNGGTLCLHLNGKTIGNTANMPAIRMWSASTTVNVMGNGFVQSNTANWGAATCQGGVMNIYGGTFSNTGATAAAIYCTNGTANIYSGTISKGVLRVGAYYGAPSSATVYGGTFPTAEVTVAQSSLTVKGGTFETLTAGGIVAINGGAITKLVLNDKSATVSVDGTPVIGDLDMSAAAVKLTVGKLSEGAKIGLVSVTGVFTTAFESKEAAEAVMEYFVVGLGMKLTVTAANELSYGANAEGYTPEEIIANSNAMTFTGNATGDAGYCYHCNKAVTWMPLTTEGTKVVGHYYLANDLISSNANGTIFQNSNGGTLCLHLNGKTIGNTASMPAIRMWSATTNVNVMGNGNVQSNSANWGSIVSQNGTLNIYGGTYSNTGTTAAAIYCTNGTANIYAGEITKGVLKVAAYYGVCSSATVYGGTFPTVMVAYADNRFTVKGGTIGNLEAGGHIAVEGGNITKMTLTSTAVEMTVSGTPTIGNLDMTASTVKLQVGALTTNAAIGITAEGVFTENIENVTLMKEYFEAVVSGKTIEIVGQALSCVNA